MEALPTQQLLPETTRLLETLTQPYPAIPATSKAVREEEFLHTYKIVH
jgi:hypothetical protein